MQQLELIAGVALKSQTSKSKLTESGFIFVLKKFTLEAIVQVARSLGTKSLDTNQIFSVRDLSVAFSNTDLKPLNNYLQHIRQRFYGVTRYTGKAF